MPSFLQGELKHGLSGEVLVAFAGMNDDTRDENREVHSGEPGMHKHEYELSLLLTHISFAEQGLEAQPLKMGFLHVGPLKFVEHLHLKPLFFLSTIQVPPFEQKSTGHRPLGTSQLK